MKNKTTLFKKIYLLLLVPIILIVMDFLNLPSYMFNMGKINWDFSSSVINSVVVIILYLITYIVLDRRTAEKEKNKNKICILLIRNAFEEAKSQAELLSSEIIEKYLVPKVDFNAVLINDEMIIQVSNVPFQNDKLILELAKDGQISEEILSGYFKVKASYQSFINVSVTFFDVEGINKKMRTQLFDNIGEVENIIKEIEGV